MNRFKDNMTCVTGSICHIQVSFGLLLESSLTSVATFSALYKYNWATFEEYNLTSVAKSWQGQWWQWGLDDRSWQDQKRSVTVEYLAVLIISPAIYVDSLLKKWLQEIDSEMFTDLMYSRNYWLLIKVTGSSLGSYDCPKLWYAWSLCVVIDSISGSWAKY